MTAAIPPFPQPWVPGINTGHTLAKGLIIACPCWDYGASTIGSLMSRGRAAPTSGSLVWNNTILGQAVSASTTLFQLKLFDFLSDNARTITDHTVSAWWYRTGIAAAQFEFLFEYNVNDPAGSIGVYFNPPSGIVYEIQGTTQQTSVTQQRWYHVAISVRGGKAYAFLDGVYLGSAVRCGSAKNPCYLLSSGKNADVALHTTYLSSFMFWNRGLGDAEIAQLAKQQHWDVYKRPEYSIPFAARITSINGSGGVIAGGAASAGYSFDQIASSGSVVSGSTSPQYQFNVTASGGALAGGSAIANKPATYTGAGGAIVSGSVAPGGSTDFGPSGGVIVSGSSAPSYVFNATGSSGVVVSGNSVSLATYSMTTSGGAVVSGTVIFTQNPTSSGGVVTSGQAVLNFSWAQTTSGGVIVSGAVGQTITPSTSGGAIASGIAVTLYQFQSIPTGGVVCAGHIPEVKNVPTSGGVLCSGRTGTDFIYRNHIEQDQVNIVYSGGINNSDPNRSLGGIASVVGIPNKLDNLFADTTPIEVTFGSTEYRAFYVFNDNIVGTMYNTKVWIDPSATVTVVAIAIGATDAIADNIGTQNNPPANISFSSPITETDGILVGTLRPLDGFYVWMRRTVIPGTQSASDDGVFFHLSATDAP